MAPPVARRLLREALVSGLLRWTGHSLKEMAKDSIHQNDVLSVLRTGVVGEAEWEHGEWRYHVEARGLCVVIAFEATTVVVVVTAWRNRP
jgi:hypothetical protein